MASKALSDAHVFQRDVCKTHETKANSPLLAATIVLVRDQPTGYEVFMIERPAEGAFPLLRAFPGGKVEKYDIGLDRFCPLLTDEIASRTLGVKDNGLRFWVGAIRECYEECGVLFARKDGKLISDGTDFKRLAPQQLARKISDSPKDFRDLLEVEELTLATDELLYFSHWITPIIVPTRFNTRFFLAKLPEEQHADVQSSEVVSACWIQPEEALHKLTTKEWRMIHPTLTTLRMISHYSCADDLIAQVRVGYHKIPVRVGKQLPGIQPFINQW